MRTTIDAAGRLVVPKALRDAMGLGPGQEVDLVFTDGRIEIEVAPIEASVGSEDGLPIIATRGVSAPLTAGIVRDTLESTRR